MGMKCDELKDYDYDPDFPFQSRGRFYDADEVENAIDELKAAHHKERHEYIEMVAQLKAKLAEQEENIMNKKKINAFDCICVTDVRISPIKQIEGLTHTKALAEVVFNDQLLIRGIRVVEGENGLYISYPFPFHPTTDEDGQPRSFVFPITKVLRDHVEAVVLEKYQDTVNNEKVTNK
jgi:stage V sporulation protein G